MSMTRWLKNSIKGNNPKTLVAFNFSIIGLAVYGALTTPFSALIAVTAFMYFIMICLGVSITYHRSLTHKAVELHPVLLKLTTFMASMAGTGSPIMWVMTHRMHHRFSDKPGDPHPPGAVWKTFLGAYPRVDTRGIRDVAHSSFNRLLHKWYFAIVAAYGATWMLGGFEVFLYGFVYTTLANIAISNALNWFGHSTGRMAYRNYQLSDTSANNPMMATLAFGEGWHNNHHRFPGSAKFGVKRWEVDISYAVIVLLSKLGLATSVKTHNAK
jgi:fatty-acid desaturase